MRLDLGLVELYFGPVALGLDGPATRALDIGLRQKPDGKTESLHYHEQRPYGLLILLNLWKQTHYANIVDIRFRSIQRYSR